MRYIKNKARTLKIDAGLKISYPKSVPIFLNEYQKIKIILVKVWFCNQFQIYFEGLSFMESKITFLMQKIAINREYSSNPKNQCHIRNQWSQNQSKLEIWHSKVVLNSFKNRPNFFSCRKNNQKLRWIKKKYDFVLFLDFQPGMSYSYWTIGTQCLRNRIFKLKTDENWRKFDFNDPELFLKKHSYLKILFSD